MLKDASWQESTNFDSEHETFSSESDQNSDLTNFCLRQNMRGFQTIMLESMAKRPKDKIFQIVLNQMTVKNVQHLSWIMELRLISVMIT